MARRRKRDYPRNPVAVRCYDCGVAFLVAPERWSTHVKQTCPDCTQARGDVIGITEQYSRPYGHGTTTRNKQRRAQRFWNKRLRARRDGIVKATEWR